MSKIEKIKERYFRKVIAHPEGAIVHHGDCMIYGLKGVCTRGLLHDLAPLSNPEAVYPQYWSDIDIEWSKDN